MVSDVKNTVFFILKYFIEYFGNISVFFTIFQNLMPNLLLPLGTNLVVINTCYS